MMEVKKHLATSADKPQSKPYRAPQLQVYGAMASLTAGGTGTVNEVMVGGTAVKKNKL